MAILKINQCVNEPKFYTGTIDVLMFTVIFGLFGAFVSKWTVTRKQVSLEKTRSEIGSQG